MQYFNKSTFIFVKGIKIETKFIKKMRKIKLLLSLAFIATFALQSCNNTTVDQPNMYALVTVHESTAGFYGKTDNGEKINAGSTTRIPSYKPKDGQRSIMYFTPLEEKIDGYLYNADVYQMVDILTKKPVLLTDSQYDTLGTSKIDITKAWLGEEFLNIEFTVLTDLKTNHILNLVDNQLTPVVNPNENGYLEFEFKHKTRVDEDDIYGQSANGIICFNISNYDILNSTGVILKYSSLSEKKDVELIVDKSKEEEISL